MSDCRTCAGWRCPTGVSRRRFLKAAAGAAAAVQLDVLDFASSLLGGEAAPAARPVISVAFALRTRGGGCTWPAATTAQLEEIRALYTKTLSAAAKKLEVTLDVQREPLRDASAYLGQIKKTRPDGLILMAIDLRGWHPVYKVVKERGDIPTIVYANVSGFTPTYTALPKVPKTFLGATPDVNWLAHALRMLRTVWRSKRLRILRCPTKGYAEAFKKVARSDELKAVADFYAKSARKVVEPTPDQIIEAAKHYIVLRRLIREGNYDGVTVSGRLCIGAGGAGANPACVAVSRLLDEGLVAACEGDVPAATCQFLTLSLFDLPGFMGNPSPNTVRNTLIVSHCTSALKLEGIDKAYRAPFVLRDFHAMGGVCPMVAWPVGKRATVMDLVGSRLILNAGRVVANTESIRQPPCGGCRTSVEFALDGVDDTLKIGAGHHKWCVLGDVARPMRAYCRLAGIQAADLTGKPLAAITRTTESARPAQVTNLCHPHGGKHLPAYRR